MGVFEGINTLLYFWRLWLQSNEKKKHPWSRARTNVFLWYVWIFGTATRQKSTYWRISSTTVCNKSILREFCCVAIFQTNNTPQTGAYQQKIPSAQGITSSANTQSLYCLEQKLVILGVCPCQISTPFSECISTRREIKNSKDRDQELKV